MRSPTPAPIVVPATGAPTCRGIALTVRDLSEWSRDSDMGKEDDMVVLACAKRADADNMVLCLRPTADRPACVGLSPTQFAVSSLQDDFAARALVVDPYDAEGNDIREVLPMHLPFTPEIHAGQRVANADGEYRVVSAKHSGGRDMEYRTDLVLQPVEMTPDEAHDVAVWEGSERV